MERQNVNTRKQGSNKELYKEKAAKPRVNFIADMAQPSNPFVVFVENLEEKKISNWELNQKKVKPLTEEEQNKKDRESVLYYFQCVLKCGIGFKFITARISKPELRIRPIRLTFDKKEDAEKVLQAWSLVNKPEQSQVGPRLVAQQKNDNVKSSQEKAVKKSNISKQKD